MANEKEEPVVAALGNALIVRKFFDYLDTKELLKVSTVNQLWKYEARCVLRDKRKCVAVIAGKRPCLRAKKLDGILGSLDVNFFSGLSIILEGHRCRTFLSRQTVQEAYGNLLTTPWKRLEFRWYMCMPGGCILGQFILRLMSRSLTLERLIINDMPLGVELKDENRPEGEFELPKLKFIELPQNDLQQFNDLFSSLISRAPNIEEIGNIFLTRSIPLIAMKALKIIKNLYFEMHLWGAVLIHNVFMSSLDILIASGVKLYTLFADAVDFGNGNNQMMMQDYLRRLNLIILSSSETLRQMDLDSFFMFGSVRANLFPPVLKNVENLYFHMRDNHNIRHLMRVPLAQMFPGVISVNFNAYRRSTFADCAEPEGFGISPWAAVKIVKFERSVCSDLVIRELGILCPNLSFLEISILDQTSESYIFPFREIWSSVPYLEKLNISVNLATLGKNFDSEFCGIHQGEAAVLRKKDDEFLKRLNIVPPFASITQMKRLKLVEVERGPSSSFPAMRRPNKNTFFLSKVTGFLACAKIPELEFRLRAPFEESHQLEHLKSFVKLELV